MIFVGAEVWEILYCSWISGLYLYYLSDSLEGESERVTLLHLSGLPLDVTHRASQPGVLERAQGIWLCFKCCVTLDRYFTPKSTVFLTWRKGGRVCVWIMIQHFYGTQTTWWMWVPLSTEKFYPNTQYHCSHIMQYEGPQQRPLILECYFNKLEGGRRWMVRGQ